MPERNLLQGWCPEGPTFETAAAAIPTAQHRARDSEFASAGRDEARAAVNLHLFTGELPHLEDTGGRQRAVDLTLDDGGALSGIAEVTSTIDGGFQRDSNQLRRLVAAIDDGYSGAESWALGFEHGWTMPAHRELRALKQTLRVALEIFPIDELKTFVEGLPSKPAHA